MTILETLKKSVLAKHLSEKELRLLVNSYDVADFYNNDVIFSEGDNSDQMFILISGNVEITQHMGLGERALKLLQIGECFGEMGVISQETRSATAIARSDVQCLVLSQDKFTKLLDTHPNFIKCFLQLLVKRLKQAERTSNDYILEAYHNVLFSLSNLAETRDSETGRHLFRVREYCKKLAQELSLLPEYQSIVTHSFIENIYLVSPIHDIGKVAIADDILLKPGKLNVEEFTIMKKHAEYGGEILKKLMRQINFPTFRMAFNVANYHHERFDGNGYPNGLKGKAIPLEARIMTIADVFDALLSKRIYKPAFDSEQVKSIMLEEKGGLFDPLLLDILLDKFDDFIAIYHHYAD